MIYDCVHIVTFQKDNIIFIRIYIQTKLFELENLQVKIILSYNL